MKSHEHCSNIMANCATQMALIHEKSRTLGLEALKAYYEGIEWNMPDFDKMGIHIQDSQDIDDWLIESGGDTLGLFVFREALDMEDIDEVIGSLQRAIQDLQNTISVLEKNTYEVVVGNIGSVYAGHDPVVAQKVYEQYCEISNAGTGRAGGEPVTLFSNNEIEKEHAIRRE